MLAPSADGKTHCGRVRTRWGGKAGARRSSGREEEEEERYTRYYVARWHIPLRKRASFTPSHDQVSVTVDGYEKVARVKKNQKRARYLLECACF